MFGLFNRATDPVCQMKVDKNKSAFFSEYEGEKYYFCSENCLKSFNKEPKQYVAEHNNTQQQSCCQQNTKSCC